MGSGHGVSIAFRLTIVAMPESRPNHPPMNDRTSRCLGGEFPAVSRCLMLVASLGWLVNAAPAARAADVVVDAFEYSSTDELVGYWTGSGNAVLSASDVVAPGSPGKTSARR